MNNVDSKHDFTSKLRQPSIFPRVIDYIKWQQSLRHARSVGGISPETPDSLFPVSINLDLTTACNFRCGHCIDSGITNKNSVYSYENLLDSLKHMIEGGLRSVIIIGGGEPTLFSGFGDIVRFLKEHGVQVAISSNGSRNRVIHNIADCLNGKDWVRLSLDSGSNETFLRLHNPRTAVSLDEICDWVPRIRARNPKLSIGFSFVIVWKSGNLSKISNIDEIVMAAERARRYGFSYISFKPFLMRGQGGAEVMDARAMDNFSRAIVRIREAVKEAKTFETDNFKVLESTNLRVLMRGNWRDFTDQPKVCHMQVLRQVLSPLGLFNCPACRGREIARIGDNDIYCMRDRAVGELLAKGLDRFDANRECSGVTCLYNEANRWIEKAIMGELDSSELTPLIERNDYFL